VEGLSLSVSVLCISCRWCCSCPCPFICRQLESARHTSCYGTCTVQMDVSMLDSCTPSVSGMDLLYTFVVLL